MRTHIVIREGKNGRTHYRIDGISYKAAEALVHALAMTLSAGRNPDVTDQKLADTIREMLLAEMQREGHR